MITFHSRQSDCARHTRKNKNVGTFNFTSQIAPSICTVAFTKREKFDAKIFTSRCSRTVLCYRLDRVEALPLVSTRFLRLANSSPKTARSPARRSRDGREPSGKTTGEISRVIAAQLPGNAGRWQQQCRRASVKTTRKTVRLAPDLAVNVRAGSLRNISQDDSSESRRHVFNHPVLKL
jgi:hypothetical protein